MKWYIRDKGDREQQRDSCCFKYSSQGRPHQDGTLAGDKAGIWEKILPGIKMEGAKALRWKEEKVETKII